MMMMSHASFKHFVMTLNLSATLQQVKLLLLLRRTDISCASLPKGQRLYAKYSGWFGIAQGGW